MTGPAAAYAFQGPGLDRADHLRVDSTALDALWAHAQVLLIDDEADVHFSGTMDCPEFPLGQAIAAQRPSSSSFLGLDEGGRAWFVLPQRAVPEHFSEHMTESVGLRSAASCWPAREVAALAHGRALLYWQARSRYCGGCGQALLLHRAGHAARCAQCGLEFYPRTDAAIIVAVSDGERLLLGRQASWPERRWSVLAGFVEPGESFEQAVAREVMEEAGVPVREATYLAAQPWPFPAALMVGFAAIAEPVEPLVGEELAEARWFTPQALAQSVASEEIKLPPTLSISRWLIERWRVLAGN